MKRLAWAICLSLVIWANSSTVEAGDEYMGFGIRGWDMLMASNITADKSAVAGTKIDFQDDFNVDDAKLVPEYFAWIKMGKSKLELSYFKEEDSAQSIPVNNKTFAGVTFNGGTPVEANQTFEMYDFTLASPFLIDLSTVRMDFLAGAKYFRFGAELNSVAARASENFDLPLPHMGLGLVIGDLSDFTVEIDAKGLYVDAADVTGMYADAQAEVFYNISYFTRVGLGYRYFKFDADTDDIDADIIFNGFTLGLYMTF